jgi:hypothetical protein
MPPLNYRPVTLVNSLDKLSENMLLRKLGSTLKELNLYRKDQYGFKKGHSAMRVLLQLICSITHGLNNNKATIALLFDIGRTYDKECITGLISNFFKTGFPVRFIYITHNYLHNVASHFFMEILSPAEVLSRHNSPMAACWADIV